MGIMAAKFTPVNVQDYLHQQPFLPIKRQDIIVNNRHVCPRLFEVAQEAKVIAAEGIHHCVQVNPANVFEHTDLEGALGKQLPRSTTRNMPPRKSGIAFSI
jgi:hypothetical protein